MIIVYSLILVLSILSIYGNYLGEFDRGGFDISYLGTRVFQKPNNLSSFKVQSWKEGNEINPEFLGTYVEGDILFPLSDYKTFGIINETKRWPVGLVPYEIDETAFTEEEKSYIFEAMDEFRSISCIRFVKKEVDDDSWILIKGARLGCYSSIGRRGGLQIVNLEPPNCLRMGTILHEFMHVIGFGHEHARSDRDDFIKDHLNEIQPSDYFTKQDIIKIISSKRNSIMKLFIIAYHLILIIKITVKTEDKLKHYARGGCNVTCLGWRVFNKPNKESSEKVRAWVKGYKENPEFLGTYVQGDILFPEERKRNGLINETMRWPLGIVPYRISNQYNFIQRYAIWRAMVTFEKEACIRFIEKTKHHKDWVLISRRRYGCYSSIGRIGGRQTVNLEPPNCLRCGTIMHELMHVIGFDHEQARYDRDEHIDVITENIHESMKYNFDKCSIEEFTDFGLPYDYVSLMHYSNYAFTMNSLETMIAKVDIPLKITKYSQYLVHCHCFNMKYFLILCIVFTVSSECIALNQPDKNQCSLDPSNFPFVVFIPLSSRVYNPSANVRCTGVLLNEKYVLTSMQCLAFVLNKVELGRYDTSKNENEVIEVEVEMRLPYKHGDLAILKLKNSIQYTDNIAPVKLSSNQLEPQSVFTSGWGLTSKLGSTSNVKKVVEHSVVDCKTVVANAVCMKAKSETNVACNGDEGSPIVYCENQEWHLYGILTSVFDNDSLPCAVNDVAIGVKLTDEIINWIKETIK
ncbi:hypothetical protein RN001_004441 [Aquatica leii]|uniref:Metalloendopeptidase n=1 Tax=Aquatica leii TaxID=1421715 RepID=A0AAN7PZY0_9COLE|nr:hypothetical protein RN001_004441 [Aquatica leii]